MKKNNRFLGLALVGVGALLLPLNADANCGVAISFGGYYSHVSGTSNGPSLRSNFWMLNAGDPLTTAGNDNGAIAESGIWLAPYGAGLSILGDWSTQNYNGCADGGGAQSAQRMVFSFSDVDGSGRPTYRVACVHRDASAGHQFNLDLPLGCNSEASCTQMPLVAAPKAVITNTVRQPSQETAITVGSPNFAPGLTTDGSTNCDAATVIPQYDVYKQQVGRDVAPTNTRDSTPWTLVGTGNTGTSFTFTTTCGGNCDVYVALAPHYNSGFTTSDKADGPTAPARVNPASTASDALIRVEAGPVLAVTPKLKNIKNVGGTKTQQ